MFHACQTAELCIRSEWAFDTLLCAARALSYLVKELVEPDGLADAVSVFIQLSAELLQLITVALQLYPVGMHIHRGEVFPAIHPL